MRRHILTSAYAFRGWKLLPYAAQNIYIPRTEFFTKEKWELLSACDGETDIDWEALTEEQRKLYEHWEEKYIIRNAKEGEKLLPYQEYRFYPARFKESVQWSITGRCNYKCKHCFMSAPHAAQGEPSWEQLMTMLDAFERCGIHNLNLTGGEPMVRRDFWNLVDEIRSRGIAIPTLFSNGLLITDDFLNKLEERHMYPSIQFSFDGIGHHDWMRGIPGAEQTVIDALKRCRDRGINTTVSMVLCKESVGSIRESVNLMASLGVSGMKIGNASPQGEWADQPEHYLTSSEVFEAYLNYIPYYFKDGKPLNITMEGFFTYDLNRQRTRAFFEKDIEEKYFSKATMCSHVRREMYVSPKGNILPCMSMVGGPIEEQFPNMLETPLEEILDNQSLYMDIINLRISDYMEYNPECKECEYREACCGGCRAIAVRDHPTDYLAKDPLACEYFKGGWMDRKSEVLRSLGENEV